MNLNKTIICILFILFVILSETKCQNILSRPKIYQKPHKGIELNILAENDERDQFEPWLVVVINDKSYTKEDIKSNVKSKDVAFGDSFWVIDEIEDYVKIVKDKRPDIFNLSNHSEVFGWISKDDVLLWREPIFKNETQTSIKALINEASITDKDFKVWKDEEMTVLKGSYSSFSQPYGFYYIYKFSADNKSALLGYNSYLSYQMMPREEPFLGWVSIEYFNIWDTRIAIEPNWSVEAVIERKKKNILPVVFEQLKSHDLEECFYNYLISSADSYICRIIRIDDFTEYKEPYYRKPGNWMRFPVIESDNTELFKVLVPEFIHYEQINSNEVSNPDANKDPNEYHSGLRKIFGKLNFPKDSLKFNSISGSLYFTTGYAPIYHPELNFPLFTTVLLLEIREFMKLYGLVDRLKTATTSPGNTRENLLKAWIELLNRHVGVDCETEYEEITLQQASSMVFGVPLRVEMLDIPLRYLTDISVFNDRMLSSYINHLVFKFNAFNLIANTNNYPYSFILNDNLYYWIDMELIP